MEAVLRAAAMYAALTVLFRITGRRSMNEVSTFDFVLLLVIGEATQQALLGNDFSLTNALLIIVTLLGIDVSLSLLKGRSRKVGRLLEGLPTILVMDGLPLRDRMALSRIGEDDILQSARETQGILRMEDIHMAVLEVGGQISIIPASDGPGDGRHPSARPARADRARGGR